MLSAGCQSSLADWDPSLEMLLLTAGYTDPPGQFLEGIPAKVCKILCRGELTVHKTVEHFSFTIFVCPNILSSGIEAYLIAKYIYICES